MDWDLQKKLRPQLGVRPVRRRRSARLYDVAGEIRDEAREQRQPCAGG